MADTNSIGEKFAWFFTGAAIGVGVGMLYAPKTGRDTRKMIGRKTQDGAEAVADTSRELLERSKDMYERGRKMVDDASELFERGRKLVQG
jgi:gas vesicle protein